MANPENNNLISFDATECSRGIAMLAIVLLHIFAITKMPILNLNIFVGVFLFISGYTAFFSNNLKKRFTRILIAGLLALVGLFLICVFIPQLGFYIVRFDFSLSNIPIFLMCLVVGTYMWFWAYLLSFLFLLLADATVKQKIIVLFFAALMYQIVGQQYALYAFCFPIGYLVAVYAKEVLRFSEYAGLLCFTYLFPLNIIAATLFPIGVISLIKETKIKNNILQFIGKNSIFIYLTHYVIILLLYFIYFR